MLGVSECLTRAEPSDSARRRDTTAKVKGSAGLTPYNTPEIIRFKSIAMNERADSRAEDCCG
jgi:hypothetical protein